MKSSRSKQKPKKTKTRAATKLRISEPAGNTPAPPASGLPEEWNHFFSVSQDLLAVLDLEGSFKVLSPSWQRVLGLDAEQLARNAFVAYVHPEDRGITTDAFQKLAARPLRNWFEIRFQDKTSGWRWLHCDANSLPDRGRIYLTARDLTEHKRAEQVIREQAALLDQAHDAISVRDLNNKIIFWSHGAEVLYGWSASEAVGRDFVELLCRKDDPEVQVAIKAAAETGVWNGELTLLAKSGSEVVAKNCWTLLRDLEGKPKSVLSIATDITEKKKLETEFLRVQRLENVGALASGIAHDLNNVLAPILMATSLIGHDASGQRHAHLLEIIQANAQRGAELIKQILSFTRGQGGNLAVIHLESILSEVARMLRHTFPKSIEIQAALPKDIFPVRADVTQIHQILMNLCVNARDAMPDGGVLKIEARSVSLDAAQPGFPDDVRPGQYTVVKISDTGSGIPPEALSKIFEPFFTTKAVDQGTGLGLFTVRKLVSEHSGFIQVLSKVNTGSCFELFFPALEAGSAVDRPAEVVPAFPMGRGQKILIVDDERAMLEITEAILRKFGYNVLLAENGIEALSTFARYKDQIGLVIVDIMMPLLDGVTTIGALQKMSPQLAIVGISGLATNEGVCRSIPRVQFLHKPFSVQSLLSAVQTGLADPSLSQLRAA